MARAKKAGGRGKSAVRAAGIEGIDSSTLAAMLAQIAAGPLSGVADDDLDRAQEKAFDAMEAPDRRRRIALAREALAISPLCSDGYFVLAEEADKPEEALDLYRQAVEAGAKALGETAFKDDVGHFWGLIETRPYMRARHALALALCSAGQHEEAIGHYQDMLRLNPNDNQGIRYCLLDALLETGRDDEAGVLVKRYKDDAAGAWAWSVALLAFRQKGDSEASRKTLSKAVAANPHVPAFLLGEKPLPRNLPDYISWGDVSEAICYVDDSRDAWTAAPGAVAWVRTTLAPKAMAGPRGDPKGEPELDEARIDEAVLALLLLGLHDGNRVWKSFDWGAMDRLHDQGLISSPASRAKSVVLTEEGLKVALKAQRRLFAK